MHDPNSLKFVESLFGKNILFFDLETTGLPRRMGKFLPPEKEYDEYTNNKSYDSSRIVQIGWCMLENFSKSNLKNLDNVTSEIRKPKDFYDIPDDSVKFHNITYDKARKEGRLLSKILNDDFGDDILKCDAMIAYNVFFDVNILLNELHRLKFTDHIDHIKKLMKTKHIIGLETICKKVCPPKLWKPFHPNQFPSQISVYEGLFGDKPKKTHDAGADVETMMKIMYKILD